MNLSRSLRSHDLACLKTPLSIIWTADSQSKKKQVSDLARPLSDQAPVERARHCCPCSEGPASHCGPISLIGSVSEPPRRQALGLMDGALLAQLYSGPICALHGSRLQPPGHGLHCSNSKSPDPLCYIVNLTPAGAHQA
uniref:Uncharacterized protein n=1 Tax=Knipowitschia caucasica TaxID=637954 RepID=A0AAV2MK91_KNICA